MIGVYRPVTIGLICTARRRIAAAICRGLRAAGLNADVFEREGCLQTVIADDRREHGRSTQMVIMSKWTGEPYDVQTLGGEVVWGGDRRAGTRQPMRVLMLSDLIERAVRKSRHALLEANVGARWLADASSLEVTGVLEAGHMIALGNMPEFGETFELWGRRYEVVDGADYATHGDPRGELTT